MFKSLRKFGNLFFVSIYILLLSSCATIDQGHQPVYQQSANSQEIAKASEVPQIAEAAQEERDDIYMLLAYAIVLKDWQTDSSDPARGHNIGSILVDGAGKVVFWARNANKITGNGTQHGEVRLIRNYLTNVKTYDLKDHVVYTTLEPCAMCSGMMVMTNIKRTVYGQTDPDFGKALERLCWDSHTLPNGFQPYPRCVKSETSKNIIRQRLDQAYGKYQQSGGKGITKWLLSAEAKEIYQNALKMFLNYQVKYPENIPILERAREYHDKVPSEYVPLTD